MYTVEFESDAAVITTLDQKDMFEDVELVIGDEGVVCMRQWDDFENGFQLLVMSQQQLLDLMAAYNSTEGAYYIKIKRKKK